MIETATLITLCMLYLIFFRPGKTPVLENPLVIERPGQYHLTLAPKLNLAQPCLEALAAHLIATSDGGQNSATHCFEVFDKQVNAHGNEGYLLAITLRNGILYFQACPPSGDDRLQTINDFAHTVLARFPDDEAHEADDKIFAAAREVATLRSIKITPI